MGQRKPNKDKDKHGLIDVLLNNPLLARLYWAFAHLDPETRSAFQQTVGLRNWLLILPCWISMAVISVSAPVGHGSRWDGC